MPDTVADLLLRSREAHQRYRNALPRRVPQGSTTISIPGDAVQAGVELTLACRLRVEAHAIDPNLQDPAWRDEPVTHDHDSLLTFYGEQLSR